MNDTNITDETDLLKAPLWDLMLSTNDCYPGCGCYDDFFDMTLNPVKKWISINRGTKVIQQFDNLLLDENIDIAEIQIQNNFPFQTFEEFREWLLEWKQLMIVPD